MLGLLFIAILFTIYGICAVAITLRNIEAQEKALNESADDLYLARITGMILAEKEMAATRKDRGEGLRRAAASTRNDGSHSHDGRGCNE